MNNTAYIVGIQWYPLVAGGSWAKSPAQMILMPLKGVLLLCKAAHILAQISYIDL